jgi:hypothetical protein
MAEQKTKYYNEAVKKAIDKYRSKNPEKYKEQQREYYAEAKEDPVWKDKFNERCRENNQRYREKMRLKNPPKSVGRPRKEYAPISVASILL